MIVNIDPLLTQIIETFCKKAEITHTEFITKASSHLIALMLYHPEPATVIKQVEQYAEGRLKK